MACESSDLSLSHTHIQKERKDFCTYQFFVILDKGLRKYNEIEINTVTSRGLTLLKEIKFLFTKD